MASKELNAAKPSLLHYIDKTAKRQELEALAALAHDPNFHVMQKVIGRKLEDMLAQAIRAAGEQLPSESEQSLRLVRFQAVSWAIDIPEAAALILNEHGE